MENSNQPISADFLFESKYIEVHGSKMHYIDEGEGDLFLLLHGNPTSSYLWRNIIPHLLPKGRCIAPDLIGMGKSDKPDIAYRYFDHYKYLLGFIEALDLKNITLVIHDWGSGLGFHYAAQHQNNIRGIAFMEAIVSPANWSQFPSDFKMGFKLMRTPFIGYLMISVMNGFLKNVLPKATRRKLSPGELSVYMAPYPNVRSRRPVRQWPREIPIDGKPADVHQVVADYKAVLQEWEVPKLLLYAEPGALITKEMVDWCKAAFPNLTAVGIGKGFHFVQETQPHNIGEAIANWYSQTVKK